MADIRTERMVYAPREWIIQAWATPEMLTNWFSPDPSVSVTAEVDFNSSGLWRILMGDVTARGTFIEMNLPSRFSYTWRWDHVDNEAAESLVTVMLTERSESSTEVLLQHTNIDDSDEASDHDRAWTGRLERLDQYARLEFS